MRDDLGRKLERVREILGSLPSALVSFSGGVDSTLLAVLAREVLGDSMQAVIVRSPLLPPRELARATGLAGRLDLPLRVVDSDELSQPGFVSNPRDRCYACRRYRLSLLGDIATREGWDAVLEGSNADDAGQHRPGRRASREMGALSPLEEAGLSKDDVRALARRLGLPNWDLPSRPCLATRFPYGMELEPALLRRVDAAEEKLEGLGLREFRVRLEGPREALLEVGLEEMEKVTGEDNLDILVKELRGLGFRRISLDLGGFRSGSMDETGAGRELRVLYEERRQGA